MNILPIGVSGCDCGVMFASPSLSVQWFCDAVDSSRGEGIRFMFPLAHLPMRVASEHRPGPGDIHLGSINPFSIHLISNK